MRRSAREPSRLQISEDGEERRTEAETDADSSPGDSDADADVNGAVVGTTRAREPGFAREGFS